MITGYNDSNAPYNEKPDICPNCKEELSVDEMVIVDGVTACVHCTTLCPECGNRYLTDADFTTVERFYNEWKVVGICCSCYSDFEDDPNYFTGRIRLHRDIFETLSNIIRP